MGTITKGILGGFSGKVGQVVGGNWKGIDYMRSKSSKRSGPVTPAQAEQQEKFALIVRCMQAFTNLLSVTFKNFANRQTAFNGAVSYNLQNAISGSQSPFSIDYAQLLLSRGDLPNAQSITAETRSGCEIKFAWQNNSGTGIAKNTDKAIPVIYCPEMHQSVYITDGEARSTLEQIMAAANFEGKYVETWLAFITEDGKKVSVSFYTGRFMLTL